MHVSSDRTDRDPSPAPSVSSVSPRGSSASRSEASLNSLFSRLANKRRLQPAPEPDNEAQEYVTLSNTALLI